MVLPSVFTWLLKHILCMDFPLTRQGQRDDCWDWGTGKVRVGECILAPRQFRSCFNSLNVQNLVCGPKSWPVGLGQTSSRHSWHLSLLYAWVGVLDHELVPHFCKWWFSVNLVLCRSGVMQCGQRQTPRPMALISANDEKEGMRGAGSGCRYQFILNSCEQDVVRDTKSLHFLAFK